MVDECNRIAGCNRRKSANSPKVIILSGGLCSIPSSVAKIGVVLFDDFATGILRTNRISSAEHDPA